MLDLKLFARSFLSIRLMSLFTFHPNYIDDYIGDNANNGSLY